MPDMEKRLEAFVRLAHGIVIFPGGAGTAEEILYLLGVLAHPDNVDQPVPVVLTGPRESADYFTALDAFIRLVLGPESAARYRIVIGDPHSVAEIQRQSIGAVMRYRDGHDDAPYFNWRLTVDAGYQAPFDATHENIAALDLSRDLPRHILASNLRQVFSGIVAGNVKEAGMAAIEARGPFQIRGEQVIMSALDALLAQFVQQGRMRLPGRAYRPCYRVLR